MVRLAEDAMSLWMENLSIPFIEVCITWSISYCFLHMDGESLHPLH